MRIMSMVCASMVRLLPNVSKPLRGAVLFLISLFLLAVIVLIALNHWNLLGEDAFGREIGKTSLQVIAVAVLGTTASLLLAAFNHHREERLRDQDRDRRLDENKDQLRKANETYANTKRARRLIRARAFQTQFYDIWDKNTPILLEVYEKYMEDINDSQLELQIIATEVETNEQAFSNPGEVNKYIRAMEKYLSEVVREYQRQRSAFNGTPASLSIAHLKKMYGMLGPTESGPYYEEFIQNHRKLMASIRHDLTSPKLNS